jgi:hypothetical protein
MTEIKREMYENSLTDLEEWFVTHFGDPANVFAHTPIVSQSAVTYVYGLSNGIDEGFQTIFRDLKRRGYIRPVKLKDSHTSRQFTLFKPDKREILYTTRDHGLFDGENHDRIIELFRQNCATVARYKQQVMGRKSVKVSEESLIGR